MGAVGAVGSLCHALPRQNVRAGNLSPETSVELCVPRLSVMLINVRSVMDSTAHALHFHHRIFMNNHDHLPSYTDSEGFLSRLEGTTTVYTQQLRVLTQCLLRKKIDIKTSDFCPISLRRCV